MRIKSLQEVVRGGLCSGCGLCESMAGSDRVQMRLTSIGYLRPQVKGPLPQAVLDDILRVCPGVTISAPARQPGIPVHAVWGPIAALHRSHAADPQVRHRSAAGGTLTALGQYILQSGAADAVLHVRHSSENPLLTSAWISRTPEDVLAGSQSRYGPAAPLVHVKRLLDDGERFAIIAKPCDVAAIRRLARLDARVDRQVTYLLTLFCGGVPSALTAEKVVRYLNVEPKDVSLFRWRGEGWPGSTTVQTHDGHRYCLTYEQTWYDEKMPWTYDIQFRCKICADATGELGDVSAPDGWLMRDGKRLLDDAPGVNLAIARTERGRRLIEEASAAGALRLAPCSIDELDKMHDDHKPRKQENLARIMGLRVSRRVVTQFRGFRSIRNAWRAGPLNFLKALSGTVRRARDGRTEEPAE